jgi:putative transcriptional regulator
MNHHAPEEMLLEYVAGTSTDAAALSTACHVALCAACAARVAELEAVGGGFLDAGGVEPLAPGALEAVLARIDAPPQARAEAAAVPAAPAFLTEFQLPRALLRRLAEAPAVSDWRFVVPGMRAVDLPASAPGVTMRLIAFKPGVTIPFHDHGGPEQIVVFTGALEEEGKRFERGDISIRDSGERHEQRVAPGVPCIALVVNEGKLQPLTLRGRLLLALSRR